jgi:peptidoglycan/xylan/chitin deacetylase (PgdA/CDA1 family)
MRIACFDKINYLKKWAGIAHQRALILAYHRVSELRSDPQLLNVSPKIFSEQMKCLQDYTPISLDDLYLSLRKKDIPEKSIVVTFDDGYADNLWNAKPILEQHGVPATIFVTTGYVNKNKELWWDELERLLLIPQKLPDLITLDVAGEVHEWNLCGNNGEEQFGKLSSSSSPQDESREVWNVTMRPYPSRRHQAYLDLHKFLRPLDDEIRSNAIDQLARSIGSSGGSRSNYRVLNQIELKEMIRSDLIDIGSHCVTHSVLKSQSPDIQKMELSDSKRYLEKIIGRPIKSMSYPFGGKDDVGKDTLRLAHDVGYNLCCANWAAPVTEHVNPYFLPRFLVRNWNEDLFSDKLREWFYG